VYCDPLLLVVNWRTKVVDRKDPVTIDPVDPGQADWAQWDPEGPRPSWPRRWPQASDPVIDPVLLLVTVLTDPVTQLCGPSDYWPSHWRTMANQWQKINDKPNEDPEKPGKPNWTVNDEPSQTRRRWTRTVTIDEWLVDQTDDNDGRMTMKADQWAVIGIIIGSNWWPIIDWTDPASVKASPDGRTLTMTDPIGKKGTQPRPSPAQAQPSQTVTDGRTTPIVANWKKPNIINNWPAIELDVLLTIIEPSEWRIGHW